MLRLTPILGQTLLLLTAPLAFGQGGPACSPGGLQLPRLGLLQGYSAPVRLLLRVDPSLVGGQAVLLLEEDMGRPLPPGACTGDLRGRIFALRPVRPGGRASWIAGDGLAGGWPRLRALAWPSGGGWGDVHVSNCLSGGSASGDDWVPGEPGVLITEIQKDPTGVPDAAGEWFEVTNLGPVAVDLEGWSVSDRGWDHALLSAGGAGILVLPGQAVVLAREADPVINGGVRVDGVYAGMTLGNGSDEVFLIRPNGTLADGVAYDDGLLWPDEPGRSLSLDPGGFDRAANDLGASWCSAETPIGGGPDSGSPGWINPDCSG